MKNVQEFNPFLKLARVSLGCSLFFLAAYSPGLQAQPSGVSTQGISGGLVIPTAEVLSTGTFAVTYGSYAEPQLGAVSTHQNMSFGIGLMSHVELFGRFANAVNSTPGNLVFDSGIRDLSPNIKIKLPTPWAAGPKVAIGLNDAAGGAVNFQSRYIVASDQYGPFKLSLGLAKGRAANRQPTFDGAFGGVEMRVADTGLSVLAEHDGQQQHAGLRWQSPAMESLGRAQWVGSVQRSFGALHPDGQGANASRFAMSLVMPLGENEARRASLGTVRSRALPPLDAKADPSAMQASAEDRLWSLQKALVAVGLERVRVGLREGLLGSTVVVEYENHRYGQNEADALGVVLGLSAEMAPRGTQRMNAVTFKDGLRLYETSVGVAVYRAFLREGPASQVRDSLNWDRLPADQAAQTRWIDAQPSAASRLRLEIKPDLNYTLGTEVSSFDYALAANIQAIAPLWSGARVYSSYMQPLDNSANMDAGAAFAVSRQRRGLKTLALQQSFWLGNQVLANVAAGRFHYGASGVQGEATVFVPDSNDVLRLRGTRYNQDAGGLDGQDRALSASYRHLLTPTIWLEAGVQRYGDGSTGPSIEWSRWFGDVAVQLYYRKGGDRQFAGLQLILPLTPRQGMAPGPVILTGASHYTQGIRTRLTTSSQAANLVQPDAVRDLRLETTLDSAQLNGGRANQQYFSQQVFRMREAFFNYAQPSLN